MKSYLGDAVYVDIERGMLKLTTEDGANPENPVTNTIWLEPEVFDALVEYVERRRKAAGGSMNEQTADEFYAQVLRQLDEKGAIVGFQPGELHRRMDGGAAHDPVRLLQQLRAFIQHIVAENVMKPDWKQVVADIDACLAADEKR